MTALITAAIGASAGMKKLAMLRPVAITVPHARMVFTEDFQAGVGCVPVEEVGGCVGCGDGVGGFGCSAFGLYPGLTA
jgi:hypothetical protein